MQSRVQSRAAAVGAFLALFGLAPAPAVAGPFGTDCSDWFRVRDYGRPPGSGEHLGDYLIAERLPAQTRPLREAQLPQTSVPLPPAEPPLMRCHISWCPEWDRRPPKLGDLPPKPGECFGEYAIANELPPRYPAPEVRFPTTTVPLPPPSPRGVEIGYRFESVAAESPARPQAGER